VTHLLIPALIALLPAAFALWTGRRLLRLADDAAFAERLLAERTRSGVVSAVCVVLLLPIAWAHAVWAVPLLIGARMAVGYWIRKALYRETWSFACYLSFFGRLIVAAFGFWVALGMIPVVAMMAGSHDWMLAGVLAVILGGWATAYSRVFSMLLRARPVGDPDILSRFAQLATQCGLRNPSLRQVDMRGGVFANAVALPSTTHPTVVVSSTLIERLDADETAGILAHELAHLEYYNPRVLRSAARVTYALIGAAVSVAPLIRLVPQSRDIALLLWPVVLITTLVVRARHKQKHETASDLRAVELTGNPDSLIRALTKLHAFARMPRRWDVEFEQQATHPSLARRIQAIQSAAGTAPPALGQSTVFVDPAGERSVTFHEDRLEFGQGGTGCHSIGYGLLTMLRVDAKRSGAPRLVALDIANRRWEIGLRQSDLARAQATLDLVDTRLAAVPGRPAVSLPVVRALVALAFLLSVLGGQSGMLLVAALGLLQPGSPLIAAVGASAFAAAGLLWRDHPVWPMYSEQAIVIAAALFVCGVVLIALRAANRHEEPSAAARTLTVVLAVCALLACGLATLSGIDPIGLHRGAREWPSAAVLSLGLAGALAFARRPTVRYAAVPAACAGLAAIWIGSPFFLERFVQDPFLAPAETAAVSDLAAEPIREFSVPVEPYQLWLSPSGRYVAVSSEDEDERMTVHAGNARGPLASFKADEARFSGDGRLLLLDRQRGAAVLRDIDLEHGNRELWSRRVPLWASRFSFSPSSNRWQLLGLDETGSFVSYTGRIGEDVSREGPWRLQDLQAGDAEPLAVSNGEVLAIETRSHSGSPAGYGAWIPSFRPAALTQSRLWKVGAQGSSLMARSHFLLDCRNAVLDEPLTCTAFDGMNTRFVALDPETRRLTALASIPGRFYLRGDAGNGWLVGWLDHGLVVIHPSARQGIRLRDDQEREPDLLAIGENVIGAVFSGEHGSTIRLYPMERQN
jgi:Zn-dependent protease with chaperone function